MTTTGSVEKMDGRKEGEREAVCSVRALIK